MIGNMDLVSVGDRVCRDIAFLMAQAKREGLEVVLQRVREDHLYHPRIVNNGESLISFSNMFDGLYALFPPVEEGYDWFEYHSLWLHQPTRSWRDMPSEDEEDEECLGPEKCLAYRIGAVWFQNYRTYLNNLYRNVQPSTNALILSMDDAVDPARTKEAFIRLIKTCLKHCERTLNIKRLRERIISLEGDRITHIGKKEDSLESLIGEKIAETLPQAFGGLTLREAILAVLGKKLNIPFLVGRRLIDELDRIDRQFSKERECPECYYKTGNKDVKLCPKCGTSLPVLEFVTEIAIEDEKEGEEGEKRTLGDSLPDDRPYEATILTTTMREKLKQYGKHAPKIIECIMQRPTGISQERIAHLTGLSLSTIEKTLQKMRNPIVRELLSEI